ncbi:MAG: branched-chain amino acid transaminase [Candidatus Aminicenantes bacterium]|nr:branched-chain amino acid transaminase [Candidatus Aminicenantes bacterium]
MLDNTHFPKAKKFWHQGKLHDWDKVTVHSMSHALHYGNSVFEGIRAYKTSNGPSVFKLGDHLDRFLHSASILSMAVPYSKTEIEEVIKLVIKENQLDSAYIRPLLFHSYGNLGLLPKHCPVELAVAAWEWGAYLGEKAETGVHTYILPWRRIHHSQFDMTAKVGGLYALSTIGGAHARSMGFDEAIFLNIEGNIAEGAGENIFIVKDGLLHTNDVSASILQGITRTSILQIAQDMGIRTSVGPITKEDFFNADEAFFSGTAVEVTPITHVTDGADRSAPEREYTIGSGEKGKLTQQIKEVFFDTVTGKIERYESWLTYVYDE